MEKPVVQGETSVIVILNFNGVYLPFWFSVSQMIWILLHDLWKCTSQQKLDRKNISLYNKNIKIGQFKLENYTIL